MSSTPEASFTDSTPLSEPRNGHGPILRLRLRLRLRFLSFFKCALLPSINHVVERGFLFVAAEQLEDIFSILQTNLHTSLDVLGWGANDVNAERSNSRRCISGVIVCSKHKYPMSHKVCLIWMCNFKSVSAWCRCM